MAGFALPSFLKWQHSSRLRGAAVNLVGDLEMAKIRAIRENGTVVAQFTASNYTIFWTTGQLGERQGTGFAMAVKHLFSIERCRRG